MSASPGALAPARGRFPWWALLGAVLLPCVYLPMLAGRFDFIDDGDLVYPTGPLPTWGARGAHLWGRIESNYRHLGPFRPFLHAYWEAEVELLGPNPVLWRVVRIAWAMLAVGAFLWLLRELGVRPVAALACGALAAWAPYRNEIWLSLTLSEAVAMPFALFALVCAIRARGSSRAWAWDLAGALAVLAALGCKNTFAALIPAQVALRVLEPGLSAWEGWRRHRWRALLLTLTMLLPLGHFLYFKLHWQAGQYATQPPTVLFALRYLRSLVGGVSIDFMGAGVALALLAVLLRGPTRAECWDRWRAPLVAGALLLVAGTAAYLPIGALSGRYTMPAVWGLDLLLAVLLSELLVLPRSAPRRAALVALGCGLAVVLVANLGKQEKFRKRSDLLWQALEQVEREAPPGACVAWQSSPTFDRSEGIHVAWHLRGRGRGDLRFRLMGEDGQTILCPELAPCDSPPDLLLTSADTPEPDRPWRLAHHFTSPFWAGRRNQHCYLWERPATNGLAGRPTAAGPQAADVPR